MEGKDTLALLPTGGGKSICFQVPALTKAGLCLVVSPLIALMKDQVDALNKKRIKAYRISSDLSKREIDLILDNCIYSDVKFLYVSPERLKSELFIERFKLMNINLIAVDEAHCISQWGYDFRPPYLNIAEIRAYHPNVPVVALTATATTKVVHDIQEKLEFKIKNTIRDRFERANISYVVRKEENKYDKLLEICQKVVGSGIVYVNSRKRTKEISEYLNARGIHSNFFHAGLDFKLKSQKQDDWIQNRCRVIVSTNAFGMGIDKPDVRFVVHMDIPNDPESYFQEAGRAGRDGRRSFAVMIFNNQDIIDLEERVGAKYPDKEVIRRVYRAVGNHIQMAIGSGLNSIHDFDLYEFSSKYNFPIQEARNSLRILELMGVFALTDAYHNPPKIMMLLNRKGLYSFQLNNEKLRDVISILLRSYEGVFDMYVKINLDDLARRLSIGQEKLVSDILQLKKKGVLHYIPMNDKSQIILLQDRMHEDRLRIENRFYAERKDCDLKRMFAMKNYLEKMECRSKMLRDYFDDIEDKSCGMCDVCIDRRKLEIKPQDFDLLQKEILGYISQSALTMDQLLSKADNASKDEIVKIVRWCLDNKIISYNEEHALEINDKS